MPGERPAALASTAEVCRSAAASDDAVMQSRAWPLVKRWIDQAANDVTPLPADPAGGAKVLSVGWSGEETFTVVEFRRGAWEQKLLALGGRGASPP